MVGAVLDGGLDVPVVTSIENAGRDVVSTWFKEFKNEANSSAVGLYPSIDTR